MFLHVDLLLRSRGAVLVYAWQYLDDLCAAINNAEDEPITADQIPQIVSLFVNALSESTLAYSDYNFVKSTDRSGIIKLAAEQARAVTAPLIATREWIGSPTPRALLVGGVFDNEAHPSSARVPYVPFYGTDGHFLMTELLAVNLTDVAICHAVSSDGSIEKLHRLWTALGRPPVVALGHKASTRLYNVEIQHEQVPPPAFSRNFQRGRGYSFGSYGHQILTAIKEAPCS